MITYSFFSLLSEPGSRPARLTPSSVPRFTVAFARSDAFRGKVGRGLFSAASFSISS